MKNQKPEVIDLETESKMIAFNQALAHSRKLCEKYDCTVKFLMPDGHSFTTHQTKVNKVFPNGTSNGRDRKLFTTEKPEKTSE